jgi:hypothetical protein
MSWDEPVHCSIYVPAPTDRALAFVASCAGMLEIPGETTMPCSLHLFTRVCEVRHHSITSSLHYQRVLSDPNWS